MYTQIEVLFASQRPAIVQLDHFWMVFFLEHISNTDNDNASLKVKFYFFNFNFLYLVTKFSVKLSSLVFLTTIKESSNGFRFFSVAPSEFCHYYPIIFSWMLISHIQPETTIITFIKLATTNEEVERKRY
ncbi:hypothetical protein H5410_036346 [Solanum commersonii]|uniref:Uncharacterized protein n=1 Tax=Solanum commersonii TaxID=4109 RepID=A0A9J5Y531_SOLCO|nr:hypothetical protein H5410_036346 [Solanum commersonii]